ncbi:hypothetical protein ACROYT_G025838 [Oculina patagonica]
MTSSCKNVKVVIYFATFCFIENAVVTNAGPTECHACTEGDAVACSANQVKQTCATNPKSLGTTHCGSMAGKFLNQSGSTVEGFIRGCIDCADKKAACFALGGALKARKMWTLKKCELECCTGNNCNTQNVTLSQNPTSVFYTDAVWTKQCHACTERDAATCRANQQSQTCATDPDSLGITDCFSAATKYRDTAGNVHEGFVRGCVDCTKRDKAACYALGGSLTVRKYWTLEQCNIECCQGDNCNTRTPTLSKSAIAVFSPTAECNACVESDAASCNMNQQTQYCGTGEHSLGTTHCASAVGKFRDKSGNVVDGFYRGCIDCTDKMTACAAIGGALKARKGWSLEKCEIECCTGNKCNTQTPTLSDDTAIPVFLPPADGPSLQCHSCLDSQGGSCDSNQLQTQVCKDDQDSLGTRQCFSAVTQYRGQNGDLQSGATKGCIDCTDVKVACAAVGGLLKERQKWNVAQCEIVCCTGNKCNTQNPTLPYPGSGGSRTSTVKGTKPTEASGQQTQHALFSVGVLAFVNILYHF